MLYYCHDANFNVTALIDTGGTVVKRYTYHPYGKAYFWEPSETDTITPAWEGGSSAIR